MTERLSAFWLHLKKNPWLLATLIVIAVFVFLRFWRLSYPAETVFDEVYFPKMASQYLAHESFFDIHPPLGKLIIAVGEVLFGGAAIGSFHLPWGNVQVGWRIMSLLAGIALLPAAYWTMIQIFNDKRAGVLAALLLSIDGLMIVYSRTGLMDIFIQLFGVLSLGFCWRFINQRREGNQAWTSLLTTGFFAGLAVAVKWIGIGFLPLVALATFIGLFTAKKRQFDFNDFFVWFCAFVVIPAILYIVPFAANWQTDFWHQFALWHQQSWDYNVHLNATHPYASKWWSWPFMIRPIWFYYKNIGGDIVGVDGIGNPIVWWGTTLGIVYTALVLAYSLLVWTRKDSQVIERRQFWPILFLVGGWAAFYLPWSVIGRVLFLYHYMTSYIFAVLLAAFWLSQSWQVKSNRWKVITVLIVAVAVGLYFAPIWIAYPISQTWFNNLMWFKGSWI